MRHRVVQFLLLVALAQLIGCMSPSGDTREEQIDSALRMRDEVVARFCADDPDLKPALDAALGYAAFSNFSIHPGLLSFGTGYGVITNKAAGRDTHARWFRLTIGPGLAAKGLYALVLFHDQEVMEEFEKGRWVALGQFEASFVFGDLGGTACKSWIYSKSLDARYATHTGVALEAELIGLGNLARNDGLSPAPER